MTPLIALSVISGYFLVLVLIANLTSGKSDDLTFFTGNKQSPWYLVAFGMIGASLSGVTFISVPGWVATTQFGYMQMVLGYLVGYLIIGTVLLPLYYRLNLVSIYTYLEQRFGFWSYKTGAFFFLLSRTIGAAFRLFLVAGVLQFVMFDEWGVPFWLTVLITIGLIWLYTFRGGIKTIVWTDALQTFFMLLAVGVTIIFIAQELNFTFTELTDAVINSKYSNIFVWDWNAGNHFVKQFFSGAFIAIVMTGLDQDMMQKNLTCRSIGDAQKNMFWFSIVLVFVNLLFLTLGALLFIYAGNFQIALPSRSDDLFPMLAIDHFSLFTGVIFLLGITAAAYSSADSALTSLTTSFCVDFLGKDGEKNKTQGNTRMKVHLGFSILLFLVIIIFRFINDDSVISVVFKVAGYTYGPLLGLYTFGLFTKWQVRDKLVPWICLGAPILSYVIDATTGGWFGFFILAVNGLITFMGLMVIKRNDKYA
jgi:Na+/proline symporter